MLDKILGAPAVAPDAPRYSYFFQSKSSAGIFVNEDTALTYSAVFAAVKVISETIALLPWRPFNETGDRREMLAGSQLDLILHRQPNPEITAFQFRELMIALALLHGNAYAEIESSLGGQPLAMHPIHPDRVEIVRNDQGELIYRVRNAGKSPVDIPSRQMFHLRGPTKDGIVGRSVITLARESWGLGIAAEQFASGFFGNGAVPSLVIQQGETAPDLSQEGAQNMLSSFEKRHKGSKGAGRPALLEKGFTIETLGIAQKDAQFLETRKFSVTDVARWFRVPPHKIADMEKSTFSNIESQERNFVNDAIMPWTIRLEQEANAKLVSDPNVITKLEIRALLRGNNEDRARFYTQMRDLGAMDINEIRALEDMNPIDGGDLRLVPLNMVSVSRAAQAGSTDPAGSVRGVLVDAHERMLTKESRALERARSSGKVLAEWAQEFYAKHGSQMRDTLLPGAFVVGSVNGIDDETLVGIVESHVCLHCESAMHEAVQGSLAVNVSESSAQADRLIGRIIGASS